MGSTWHTIDTSDSDTSRSTAMGIHTDHPDRHDRHYALLSTVRGDGWDFGARHINGTNTIRTIRAEALKRHAEVLPRDDQRGIAFTQSAGDPISNVLFSSMPDAKTPLTTNEFWSAVQNKLGLPRSACVHLVGSPLRPPGRAQTRR